MSPCYQKAMRMISVPIGCWTHTLSKGGFVAMSKLCPRYNNDHTIAGMDNAARKHNVINMLQCVVF